MSNEPELMIPFVFGQNNKIPEVTAREFFATKIENVSPEDGHLRALAPLLQLSNPATPITNFAFTFEPGTRISDLYAFGTTGVFRLTSASATSIFTPSSSAASKWACVPWKTAVYFTRPSEPIRKAQGSVTTAFSPDAAGSIISAKYAVAAHDHLFLGNVSVNNSAQSTTVMWSDLYNPENFNVSETTEADSYSLSVDDLEITGLELHRNQVLIFTYNSIWTANYEGLPGVYGFSPLFTGVGNSYHYSCAKVQDKVYFISTSGIYKIDSFQLIPIGQEIWNSLKVDLQGLVDVPSVVDERRKLIYWNVGSKSYVFNYEENRWAVYSFVFCTALVTFPGQLSTTDVIDNILVAYTALTGVTFNQGYNTLLISLPQMLARAGVIYQPDAGTLPSHTVTIDLPPFFLDSLWVEKELLEVKLVYKIGAGAPPVTLTTSYQDSLSGPVKSTDSKLMETVTDFAGEAVFKVKSNRVGKLIKMSITYPNTATDYVRQIVGLSLRFVDAAEDK